jgi:rhodanese-related sulfurtransferase
MRNCQLVKIKIGHRHPNVAIALFFVTLVSALSCNAAPPIISQQNLLQKLEKGSAPFILDVRTQGEYQSGHVPQAINIPHYQLANRLGELPAMKDREIVTYCERGPRAGGAENILQKAGFTAVRHLEGDMYSWRHNGLPIEFP